MFVAVTKDPKLDASENFMIENAKRKKAAVARAGRVYMHLKSEKRKDELIFFITNNIVDREGEMDNEN